MIDLSCVLFLQEIGGVELSAGGGALGFTPFVVSCCEESFEANPSFFVEWEDVSRLCSCLKRDLDGRRSEKRYR